MKKFLYDDDSYVCNKCLKKCRTYYIFTDLQINPFYYQSLQKVLELYSNSDKHLQFYCKDCYNLNILEHSFVAQTFSRLKTQINDSNERISYLKDLIHEQNLIIQKLEQQKNGMFSFHDIHREYKKVESLFDKFKVLFQEETFKNEIKRVQQRFKSQNVSGLLTIQKQLESFLESNILETKENIDKIQQMNSQFKSISNDLVDKNVVSKSQMEKFIDEQIQNQNLDLKVQMFQEIKEYVKQHDKEPQSQMTNNQT